MDLPKHFKTGEGDSRTHVLQLLKNLYEKNQTGLVWNHHLNDALHRVGFKQSAIDECVWYQDQTIFFYYVDNVIFVGPDSGAIEKSI